MGNRFSSGKNSIAICDRCGFQFKLHELRQEIIKTKNYNILVCSSCWDPDQPQLQLGMYPVDDPQGVRNPRPDTSYYTAGLTGLQIDAVASTGVDSNGTQSDGSRVIQWGWNPIGGARAFDAALTPNILAMQMSTGSLTISITPHP